MVKAIKVMLIPNNVQKTKMFQYAGSSRFSYNWALAREIENYEKGGKFLSDAELRKEFTKFRHSDEYRILEWREDYKEYEPGHRHISHLYGLHPSSQITMDGTPQLAEAARRTLEGRLSHGGGHTGWSRAWIINHYAKLWDGEASRKVSAHRMASSSWLRSMHLGMMPAMHAEVAMSPSRWRRRLSRVTRGL